MPVCANTPASGRWVILILVLCPQCASDVAGGESLVLLDLLDRLLLTDPTHRAAYVIRVSWYML